MKVKSFVAVSVTRKYSFIHHRPQDKNDDGGENSQQLLFRVKNTALIPTTYAQTILCSIPSKVKTFNRKSKVDNGLKIEDSAEEQKRFVKSAQFDFVSQSER